MKFTVKYFLFIIPAMPFWACTTELGSTDNYPHTITHAQIFEKMASDYVQMPEKQIAEWTTKTTYAQYAMPTERYTHGALGDQIEAGQLVVFSRGVFMNLILPEAYVFEDIRPRLADVDGDKVPEIITIRSKIGAGAGIVVYKIENNKIEEYGFVKEIGTQNRWLNIAAIQNMDADSLTELLWIETPHIGGILKVAKITKGEIKPIDSVQQFSNHLFASLNLCLSAVTFEQSKYRCYVPNQNRDKIAGFTFSDGKLTNVEEINQIVDFSIPLYKQYAFKNLIPDLVNCIE